MSRAPWFGALLGLAAAAAVTLPSSRANALLACDPDPAAMKCCTALGSKLLDGAFKDSKGRTGYELVTAKLFRRGGTGGCHGTSTAPATVADAYTCDTVSGSFADTAKYLEKLDFKWAQSAADSSPPGGDPAFPGHPKNGLVFDLGGPSNQVVVFPTIDHGPNPFESIEYNVWLTDNPDATEYVLYKDVIAGKVDPTKWNEAVVLRGYKEGWDAAMIADGVVFVFGLPCGINFRYVSVGAGNSGNPAAECKFIDGDNELDAVAGLTEGGEGICPDRDKDGYADCACAADKTLCDCVDDPAKDPDAAKIHPFAAEGCGSTKDLNCDGKLGVCPDGKYCRENGCRKACITGEFKCEAGTTCDKKTETVDGGATIPPLCMPAPCDGTKFCTVGEYCIKGKCVDPCADAKCPIGQKCVSGECVDPCTTIKCPTGQFCTNGECVPKCSCLAVSPCKDPAPVCAIGGSSDGKCVPKGCDTVTCPTGQHCETDPSGIGVCKGACDGVVCPIGRKCVDGKCADPCSSVTCPDGVCFDGTCMDPECVGVICDTGKKCVKGTCVEDVEIGGEVCLGCDDSGVDSGLGDASTGDTDPGLGAANPEQGGCGCTTVGTGATFSGLTMAALALTAALGRRRRR